MRLGITAMSFRLDCGDVVQYTAPGNMLFCQRHGWRDSWEMADSTVCGVPQSHELEGGVPQGTPGIKRASDYWPGKA